MAEVVNIAGAEAPKADPSAQAIEAVEKISSGKFKLMTPIQDGDKTYEELTYDFNKLTGWEVAKAMNQGGTNGNASQLNEMQAIALFAAAAAKCTGGLDATDIRQRLGAADAITAISLSTIFFRGTLLAGSLRITKE